MESIFTLSGRIRNRFQSVLLNVGIGNIRQHYFRLSLGCSFFVLFPVIEANAQSGLCTLNTPFYIVNLTGNPAGTWISPPFIRDGYCCGVTNPDRCLEFQVTLDSNSTGLIFGIASGAVPPGAIFYQVNCGPPTPVGTGICLTTPGPHTITFCKPGNNENTYAITSVPHPSVPQTLNASAGCPATITIANVDPSTVSWNDITSGSGIYNTYLSCTYGCGTTLVTPQAGHPAFADYQVCAAPFLNTCAGGSSFCDTVRVYFIDDATLTINPNPAEFCSYAGGITLTGSFTGGLPPFTYFWTNNSNGGGTVVDNDNIYYATTAGTYSFVVRDSRYPGCPQASINVPVVIHPSPVLAVNPMNPSICQGGSVLLNVTGANSFVWTPPTGLSSTTGNSVNANPITSTTYTVTGSSMFGCTNVATVNVTVNLQPVITAMASDTICYGSNNGFSWVNCSGGSFPYTYLWSNGNQTSVNTNLTAGTYSVTLTDNNGCTAQASETILQSFPIFTNINSFTHVSCLGGSNGTATVSSSGGKPPYTYNWSNGGNTATQNNLTAGLYQVTVTDNMGCTSGTSIIITQPSQLIASIPASSNVSCYSLNNGTATISAGGGTMPYTYLWSNGLNIPTISGLASGVYTVTTTDNNNCSVVSSVIITQPTLLTSGVSQSTNVSCFGSSNGSAGVTANGGMSPYYYFWSNGSNTINTTGLSAGTYYVTTTDNNGCQTIASVIITHPAVLTTTVSAISNASCYGSNNGAAVVMTNGGTAPYNINWSNGTNSNIINGLTAGLYSVTITDYNGCNAVASVNITQPTFLSSSISSSNNVSCYGGTNGSATVTALGGAAPYSYNWSNGSNMANNNNLAAGNYSVTITDNNGCSAYTSLSITQPSQMIINTSILSNVACYGGNNGSAIVTTNGGNAPYSYYWSNGTNSAMANGLTAGNYMITVSDFNGCTTSSSITVTQSLALNTAITSTNTSCAGINDGSAAVTVTGGTFPYVYTWSNGFHSSIINGLPSGNYSVIISDNNGCYAYASVNISDTPQTVPVFSLSTSFCKNSQVSILSNMSSNGITGTWYPMVIDNTVSGAYVFTPNPGQCASNTTLHVTINPLPIITASAYPSTVCTGSSSVLTATGASIYTWEPGNLPGPSVSVMPVASTIYTVTGTSLYGCMNKSFLGVDLAPDIPVYFDANPKTGCAPLPVEFSLISTGLIDTNSLQWNFGDPITSADVSNSLTPNYIYTEQGNFIVNLNALSTYGCPVSGTDTITVWRNPIADFTTHPDFGDTENPIITFYDQSQGASSWNWNFGNPFSGTDNFSNLRYPVHYFDEAGNYTVELIVSNEFNCLDTVVKSVKILETFAFFVPNAFTPNGDIRNEGFKGLGIGIDESRFEMRIYDRWGKIIFKTNDYNESWDGTSVNKKIKSEQSIYVWQVNVADRTGMEHNLTGTVALIR